MTSRFALDKSNAKILGVCAGIARSTNIDPLAVRLIAAALTLFLLGPIGLLIYFLVGWLANQS
jgi:phage shock protein C